MAVQQEFSTVVRERSWDWLAALQRRLSVERLLIVDDHGSPLVPDVAGSWGTTLGAPQVLAAISQSIRSKTPESLRLGRIQVTCIGLAAGDARGALVLMQTVTDASASESRTELELVAAWLRPAVEAHLESSPHSSLDHERAPRVSALFRVLSEAASSGSEATLVRLFADALAIWHDVDLRAYVEDAAGDFRLAISLPGASAAAIPAFLFADQWSIQPELTRLSGHELEVLGFDPEDIVLAARVGEAKEGTAWLLVLCGAIESAGDARLALYVDIVRQALQHIAASSLLRLERTIWRHLVGAGDRLHAAADRALREVREALDADMAALSIALPRGGHVRGGDVQLLADRDESGLEYLRTSVALDEGGTLVIAVQGSTAHVFSSRDREILASVAQLLASWTRSVAQRTPAAFDRRTVTRPFEDRLEDAAILAAERGTSASIVVIKMSDAALPAGVTHKMAAQLRTHLRAGESVGALGSGEIGLLLYDSTPDVARSVVGRLQRAVAGEFGDPLATAAVGVAYCGPGADAPARLVHAAREDADGRTLPAAPRRELR